MHCLFTHFSLYTMLGCITFVVLVACYIRLVFGGSVFVGCSHSP